MPMRARFYAGFGFREEEEEEEEIWRSANSEFDGFMHEITINPLSIFGIASLISQY